MGPHGARRQTWASDFISPAGQRGAKPHTTATPAVLTEKQPEQIQSAQNRLNTIERKRDRGEARSFWSLSPLSSLPTGGEEWWENIGENIEKQRKLKIKMRQIERLNSTFIMFSCEYHWLLLFYWHKNNLLIVSPQTVMAISMPLPFQRIAL